MGDNQNGQLGLSGQMKYEAPKEIMHDVKAAAAGYKYSVVLKTKCLDIWQ